MLNLAAHAVHPRPLPDQTALQQLSSGASSVSQNSAFHIIKSLEYFLDIFSLSWTHGGMHGGFGVRKPGLWGIRIISAYFEGAESISAIGVPQFQGFRGLQC